MLSILTFIAILGIMVFVHELGHFLVCKKVGVKVLVFSLGMGPKLFARQRGETLYQIACVPIGGFVKMLGEDPGETDDTIDPADIGRSYWAQAPLKRAAITAAGPILNIALAFLIIPLAYIIGMEQPSYPSEPTFVQGIVPDSPADLAGFQYGDKILTVNGKAYKTWEALEESFIMGPGEIAKIEFERGGETKNVEMKIVADEKYGVGISGFNFYETTAIDIYDDTSPAKAAGIQNGDRVVSIAGKPVKAFSAMRAAIQESGGQPIVVVVARSGAAGEQMLSFNVTPTVTEDEGGKRFVMGVRPHIKTIVVKYGVFASTKVGWAYLIDKAAGQFKALKKMIDGTLSARKSISGPIGIGFVIDYARKEGISTLIQITAVISMLLGIINLFPLPALDGGHIIMALIELVSRRKLPRKIVDFVNFTGFALLIGLMLFVTVLDVARYKDSILQFFGIN